MKFAIAMLLSVPALACPNLAGTYPVCQSEGTEEISELIIKQNGIRFEITQSLIEDGERISDTIVADNKVRRFEDGEGGEFSILAVCSGNKLIVTTISKDSQGESNLVASMWKTGATITSQVTGVDYGETVNNITRCK